MARLEGCFGGDYHAVVAAGCVNSSAPRPQGFWNWCLENRFAFRKGGYCTRTLDTIDIKQGLYIKDTDRFVHTRCISSFYRQQKNST